MHMVRCWWWFMISTFSRVIVEGQSIFMIFSYSRKDKYWVILIFLLQHFWKYYRILIRVLVMSMNLIKYHF